MLDQNQEELINYLYGLWLQNYLNGHCNEIGNHYDL